MPDLQLEVRPARPADIERIQDLLHRSRRLSVGFGYEDLVGMIGNGHCVIADTGEVLWGFACASVRAPGLAHLRGIGIIDGWRVETGLAVLLQPLETGLGREGAQHLLHLATELWLTPALTHEGYATTDSIITYQRSVPLHPLLPDFADTEIRLRPLELQEIEALARLDHQTFGWPWQFTQTDLVKLLLTASRVVVLEHAGELVGYACTDVAGGHAQIIRLAVDPAWQGRGLGRYLLADAIDFAGFAQAHSITLNTQWRNTASQRLYQGFGFRVVGRRVPVMIKRLQSP